MNDSQTIDTIAATVTEAAETVQDAAADTTAAAQDAATSIAAELKEFGVRIAAVAQAAINTPEAQDLRNDVIDGMRQLREQFDGLLENLRAARKNAEAGEAGTGSKLATQVRGEAATLLRGVNRGLEKLAGSIAPANGAPTAGSAAAEAPVAGDDPGATA